MAAGTDIIGYQLKGDKEKAALYTRQGQVLAQNLIERINLGEVKSASTYQWLDDGKVLCQAIVAMGTVRVRITAGEDAIAEEAQGFYPQAIPDFVSGVTEGGNISAGYMRVYVATDESRRKFKYPSGWFGSDRLAVEPWLQAAMDLTEFDYQYSVRAPTVNGFNWLVAPTLVGTGVGGSSDLDEGSSLSEQIAIQPSLFKTPSQYAKLKPSFFSGRMREVVQILMGFGRYTRTPIYKWHEFDAPPPRYISTYEIDILRNGRQVRYDYHWMRTHGITKAHDGKLWVVQISQQGILAMPLYMHEYSETPEFREYLERTSDVEGIAVLDAIEGFPTGESLPVITAEIEEAINAGIVLRLADAQSMQPYFQTGYYSNDMGWAFSYSGSEAHNTSYDYDGRGQMIGCHWSININIGETREVEPPPQADYLLTRLKRVSVKSRTEMDILARKIDMMTTQQASQLVISNDENFVKTLKDMTVIPLTSGSASLSLEESGSLWTTPAVSARSLLKFYDSTVMNGAIASFMMKPLDTFSGSPAACDTTVFVFFDGDSLKKCKYFMSFEPPAPDNSQSSEPACPIGSWSSSKSGGGGTAMGNFYTTDLDTREEAYPNSYSFRANVTKGGYHAVMVTDYLDDVRRGSIRRFMALHGTSSFESRNGYHKENSLVWPGWDREAYYYATYQTTASSSSGSGSSSSSMQDPVYGEYYRTIFPDEESNGYYSQPHPVCGDELETRRIEIVNEGSGGGGCSGIASSGSWISKCQDIEGMEHYDALPGSTSSAVSSGVEKYITIDLYLSGHGIINCKKREHIDPEYTSQWMINSPTPEGKFQYLNETRSCFGKGLKIRYDTDINAGREDIKTRGIPQSGEYQQNITFIGVM